MTDLTPYETLYRNSLDELRGCPSLELHETSLGRIGDDFSEVLEPHEYDPTWAGVEYDSDFPDFFLRFQEVAAFWATVPPLPQFSGEFSIPHLDDIMAQPIDPWVQKEPTQFRKEFVASLRCVDSTPRSGSGRMAFLRLLPDHNPLEMWYSDLADMGGAPYPPGFIRMNVTYREYLDALLLTKGTFGWQYLYVDIFLGDDSWCHITQGLRAMLDVFPELFPEHDYAPLCARLEARL
ncbi:hypothetical protein [Streptomyces sp. TP-A0874]|uniref:hypothetical protein n=1 Tax=Streptomyces sp. TP-A0874 TaxID=549819 RepID=UPI0008535F47|nr:hypothetical protein [Streptomyces sp. TP-A0874]